MKSREERKERARMKQNRWNKYLKIICSGLLILSMCFSSLDTALVFAENTLECFMNNNQSYKKTSSEMFVHYRTVTYRMKKIVEISGMNFDNVTEMLAVRNGLIILRIIEAM